MLTESDARGNITLEDLQGAFEEYEADRIATIVGYWPVLKENLYGALGLSPDGKAVSDQGLIEGNLERYRLAFDALRLINIEFLSRCCARLSRMMTRPEDELKQNAELIDQKMVALDRLKVRPVARLDPRAASEPDKLDFHPLAADQVSLENRPSV